MTKIYTLVNQKGGVGKTTSAINLGAYFAIFGQKVLIIDLDPQANASSSLGIDKTQVKNGTYEVLIGNSPPAAAILYHKLFKLSILPSSPALAGAEVELLEMDRREHRLKETIEKVASRYDYILIDCPPSLSILTVNGLMAARDGVLIPVQCEYLALEGIGQLTLTIKRVQASLYPGLKVRGVMLTMYDGRTTLAGDVVGEVRKHFQAQVFSTIIPRSIRLAEAPSYGKPIAYYSPSSAAARCYSDLAREILTQDGVDVPYELKMEGSENGA
jgi:chromosome partitioning protein